MDDVKRTKGAVAGARLTELSDFALPLLLAAGQRLAMQLPQTSFHTITTNVPGPQRPVYFVGRRMLHTAPTIPLAASLRTAVGIFSYDGTLDVRADRRLRHRPRPRRARPRDRVRDRGAAGAGHSCTDGDRGRAAACPSHDRSRHGGCPMTAETAESAASLSDLPSTLAALPGFAAQRFGDRPAQRFARDGAWHDVSYIELDGIGREIALGLITLGVAAGDRVCVLADTRPEWLQAEVGIALAGAVTVPIYPSSSTDECEWVIGNSGAVAVVCENAAQVAKVEQVRGSLPNLRHIVTIDGDAPGVPTLAELRAEGDQSEIERRIAAVRPDEPGLIIYTSGTTGRPKGCVLSHRALTACCRVTVALDFTSDEDVVYLFLPLAHVYAQVIVLSAAGVGAAVAYCSGGAQSIMADLAAASPTVVPSVPRIFEKVYAMVSALVPDELRERAVGAGLAVARAAEGRPARARAELQAGFDRAEEQLFSKVRAGVRRPDPQRHLRCRPDQRRHPALLPRCRRTGHEGYGMSESTASAPSTRPTTCGSAPSGGPCPGPRSASPTTARS